MQTTTTTRTEEVKNKTTNNKAVAEYDNNIYRIIIKYKTNDPKESITIIIKQPSLASSSLSFLLAIPCEYGTYYI